MCNRSISVLNNDNKEIRYLDKHQSKKNHGKGDEINYKKNRHS